MNDSQRFENPGSLESLADQRSGVIDNAVDFTLMVGSNILNTTLGAPLFASVDRSEV